MFWFSIIKKKTNKTDEMKVIFACFKVSKRMNVSLFHIDYSTLFIKTTKIKKTLLLHKQSVSLL